MKKTAVRALCKRLRKARKSLARMYAGGQDGAQSTAGEQLLAFLPQLCEAAESGLREAGFPEGNPEDSERKEYTSGRAAFFCGTPDWQSF